MATQQFSPNETIGHTLGATAKQAIPTLSEILAADPEPFVQKYTDIAAVNLACAVGLPKAEDIDIPKCLAALEAMALWTRQKTGRQEMLTWRGE